MDTYISCISICMYLLVCVCVWYVLVFVGSGWVSPLNLVVFPQRVLFSFLVLPSQRVPSQNSNIASPPENAPSPGRS